MMKYRMFYLVFLTLMAVSSIYMFKKTINIPTPKFKFKNSKFEFLKKILKTDNDAEINKLFSKAGLSINIYHYQTLRHLIIIVIFTITFVTNHFNLSFMQLLILFLVYAVSIPKLKISGKNTPFLYFIDLLTMEFKNNKNIEVYRSLSQLKNMAIVDNQFGTLFIFEQLKKFSNITRPVFNNMINLYSQDRKEEAFEYFKKEIGTREGEELANILSKIDYLTPLEVRKQLILYQENIRKERETQALTKAEHRSNLIYILVIASTSAILINFLIIAFLIDTMDMLKFIY